jgi:hypothetical protein
MSQVLGRGESRPWPTNWPVPSLGALLRSRWQWASESSRTATLGRISEHEDVPHFMRDNVSVHVERRANIRMPHEFLSHRQSEFPRPPAGDGTFPVAATLPSLQCPNGSA